MKNRFRNAAQEAVRSAAIMTKPQLIGAWARPGTNHTTRDSALPMPVPVGDLPQTFHSLDGFSGGLAVGVAPAGEKGVLPVLLAPKSGTSGGDSLGKLRA